MTTQRHPRNVTLCSVVNYTHSVSASRQAFTDALEHVEVDIRALQARQADLRVTISDAQTALEHCESRLAFLAQSKEVLTQLVSDTALTAQEAGPSTGSADPPPAGARSSTDGDGESADAPLSRCDQIQEVVDRHLGRGFRPREIAELLGWNDEGNDETAKVRSLMKYMEKRGRLRKNADGAYQSLAASSRAAQSGPHQEADPGGETPSADAPGSSRTQADTIDVSQVLAYMRESPDRKFRPHQIADELAILNQGALRRVLKELVEQGRVSACSSGRYQYAQRQHDASGRAV